MLGPENRPFETREGELDTFPGCPLPIPANDLLIPGSTLCQTLLADSATGCPQWGSAFTPRAEVLHPAPDIGWAPIPEFTS